MKTTPSRSQPRIRAAVGLPRVTLPRRRVLTLAATGAAASLLAPAGRSEAQSAQPVREVLPNGLTVIVEERPTAAVVALNLTVLAGSRDDGDTPGITLLTSRAMLAGTSRRPSNSELVRTAALVGGTVSG